MTNQNEWYQQWFDTSYYHILYQHRDENEAQFFIRNLVEKIGPNENAHILDLACGRGRHALYLHQQGLNVTGIDLSESNIAFAKRYEEPGLNFEQGDMRHSLGKNRFDFVFNLFTSFGYFDTYEDDLLALKQVQQCLVKDGLLILDFMNVNKVRLGLVKEEVRKIDGIEFHIERFIRDARVIKRISFTDQGRAYQYEEKVQLLDVNDFRALCEEAGLMIEKLYGDFELNDFDPRNSERLILFARAK